MKRIVLAPLLVVWLGVGIASKAALILLILAVVLLIFALAGRLEKRLLRRN